MRLRELCTVTLTFSRVKRSITLERYYLMAERENKSIKACARNIYPREICRSRPTLPISLAEWSLYDHVAMF